MNNKLIKSVLLLSVAGLVTACDFEEKNTDPNNSTTIEPGPLLTYTQMNTTTGGATKNMQVGTCMMLVQQTATLNSSEASAGDKYYMMSAPANTYFLDYYSSTIKNWREMEYQATLNPDKYQNMIAVAKIWGAYLFQRMTDLYGNVPYSEAGLGFHEAIYKPKYDSQESIYYDMIDQVQAGIELLSEDKPAISGDLFYDGNIAKWRKFGHSLLLRLGMRLCKVDPAQAAETAKAAIDGGIMNEAGDICMVRHNTRRNEEKNPLSYRFSVDNYVNNDIVKISKTFMDYLKETNDPRIRVFCSLKNGDNNPDKQVGLPNGYDSNNIPSYPGGYLGKEAYSNFNINTILKMDAPTLFLMPSESKLLQAEAALRGWVSGDANTLYQEAVTLSMKEQEIAYGITISNKEIETFLAQDLFGKAGSTEEKMEVLGKQYWVATFMNGYESYANWRRCGYPKLTPTHYSGNESNGEIPRRVPYPTDEYTINKANLEDAIHRQGADNVNTRVWWDK